jgi:hypothetical protein
MGRQLLRLADGSGFSFAGERIENGATLELQLERDLWVPGTVNWSPSLANAVLFIVKLGGPHERHGTPAPEVHLRLDLTDAWFRLPAERGN